MQPFCNKDQVCMKNLMFSALVLLLLASCAEEPSTVVDPTSNVSGTQGQIGDSGGDAGSGDQDGSNPGPNDDLEPVIKKNALKYNGFGLIGGNCNLLITTVEKEGSLSVIAKLDYIIHDQQLPSMTTNFYSYNPDADSNSYSDINSGLGDISFAGIKRSNTEIYDMNSLESYEQDGSLEYFLRVDTTTASNEFGQALEAVIEDPTKLSENLAILNQVTTAYFKVLHLNHYDPGLCLDFEIDQVTEIEFKL